MSVDFAPAPLQRGQSAREIVCHPGFTEGLRAQLPVALGIAAWGLVTGVAMVKTGLSVPMAVLMSLLVFAGSAQLTVLPLLALHSPLWIIWLTAACVNLRFVIFSSMWREPFGHLPLARRMALMYASSDTLFVLFFKRFKNLKPSPEHEPYFWGGAAVTWVFWQASSFAGIALAQLVPVHWGLGFAGTLALLGVTMSLLVDRYAWLALVVAGAIATWAYSLPLRLNVLVAIAATVVIGLLFESTEKTMRELQQRKRG